MEAHDIGRRGGRQRCRVGSHAPLLQDVEEHELPIRWRPAEAHQEQIAGSRPDNEETRVMRRKPQLDSRRRQPGRA